MQEILAYAQGPIFRLCFIIMVLGFFQHIVFAVWGIIQMIFRARDRDNAYGKMILRVISWMFPIHRLHRNQPLTSYSSFIFHVGLIIVPLFLLDHINLWRSGIGFGWPGLSKSIADILTLTALASGAVLLGLRIFTLTTRQVSSFMDYFLLVLLLLIFSTGYIASRPYNPVPYATTMFFHAMAGNILMILAPFSKITHCILYPFVRVTSELAWKFPPEAGRDVEIQVHGEVKPI